MKVVSVTFHAPLDLSIHKSQGLYDPSSEHDACGVGMVTTLNKRPERKIIDDAIEVLVNLNHRGAVGAEENTGDGAGILMSMPDEFMRATAGVELPEAGHYAAGIAFLDRDIERVDPIERGVLRMAAYELKHRPDVPYRVVLNEAVEVAKRFGSEHGHTYVNGVLDKLAHAWRATEAGI